jgi:hypothetical protein
MALVGRVPGGNTGGGATIPWGFGPAGGGGLGGLTCGGGTWPVTGIIFWGGGPRGMTSVGLPTVCC